MTDPWQCPSCGAEHNCDSDGPPIFAGPPVVQDMPPASGENTNAPVNVTVNVHGSVVSERGLARAVQRASRWNRS